MQSSNAVSVTLLRAAAAAPAPSPFPEVTVRPEPGVGRGLWEAPPWVFLALLVAATLSVVVYVAAELRRRRGAR